MVLLIMTLTIVEALEKLGSHQSTPAEDGAKVGIEDIPREPSLPEPSIGKPISHGQVIDIYKQLKAKGHSSYHLDTLLRGSKVYIPPPTPKPEPTPEYKALMARLRREEEARAYSRMLNPPPPLETFAQRFPTASAARAFSSTSTLDTSEDDLTYDDINRQITLIFNVLISIVACAAAIWMAAKWWDTPARLALSMSGSALVGVAEVVVYNGYLRRIGEAKGREGKVREVKEVVRTWVVGGEGDDGTKGVHKPVGVVEKEERSAVRERKRRKEAAD